MIPITQPCQMILNGLQNIEIHHKKSKKSSNDTSICEQETLQLSELSSMFKLHVDDKRIMRNQS